MLCKQSGKFTLYSHDVQYNVGNSSSNKGARTDMEITLIRHGQSMHNVNLSESYDSPLTALGEQQVLRAAQALQDEQIDIIYCSLMQRALHSASIIGKKLGVSIKARLDLAENRICLGEKGLPRSVMETRFPEIELPDSADEEGWARHWDNETREEMSARMSKVADWLMNLAVRGVYKHMAIIIHGNSSSTLLGHLLKMNVNFKFNHGNGGISHLTIGEDGFIKISMLNRECHLKN